MVQGCPYEQVKPETRAMIAHYNDWDVGINPVTTGRASWLPGPFIQAMHVVRSVVNEANAEARRKAEEKRKRKYGG